MSESDLKDLKSEIFKYKGRKFKRQHQPAGLLAANKDNASLHQSVRYPPTNTSPSRSIILPPPQPLSSNKKRPISAKGRPRPQTIGSTLESPDKYRLQFALQHYQPLPPITDSEPQPSPNYSPLSNKHHLYDVDSAVDLEYSSQCGTPIDLPSNFPVSYSYPHSTNDSTDNAASSPCMTGSPRLAIFKSLCPKTSPKSHVKSASPDHQPHSPNLSHLHTINLQVVSEAEKPQQSHFRQYESESALKYAKESSTPTKKHHSLPDHHNTVQLGLKLPNGDRIQAGFPLTATLEDITLYAESCTSTDLHECTISTNEVPRKVFNDKTQTLHQSGITVRTVLYFSLP